MLTAFGIFSRVLEDHDEYKLLHRRDQGIGLADSITVDGHKVLNVVSRSHHFFSPLSPQTPSLAETKISLNLT